MRIQTRVYAWRQNYLTFKRNWKKKVWRTQFETKLWKKKQIYSPISSKSQTDVNFRTFSLVLTYLLLKYLISLCYNGFSQLKFLFFCTKSAKWMVYIQILMSGYNIGISTSSIVPYPLTLPFCRNLPSRFFAPKFSNRHFTLGWHYLSQCFCK